MKRTVIAMAVFGLSFFPSQTVSAGGGGGRCVYGPETVADARTTTVHMKAACFTPTIVRVEPGSTVTWVNDDHIVHVILGNLWGAGGELRLGESASHRFDSPGIYPYTCYLHPGMNGAVVVGEGEGATAQTQPTAPSVKPVAFTKTPGRPERVPSQASHWIWLALVPGALFSAGTGYAIARLRRRQNDSGEYGVGS
jgi:plastocyanin